MDRDFYPAYYELEGRHWWFLGRRELVVRVLEQRLPAGRAARILDFGCGTGALLADLDRFGSVAAVDADPSAVEFCRARGRAEVQLVVPGASLPFDDGAFDGVLALDVVEHIDDDVATLSELRRVLRPGGLAVVAVPAFMFLWGRQDEVSHHRRRYTARSLRRALGAAGLRIDRLSYFNTALFPAVAAVRLGRRLLRAPVRVQSDFEVGPERLNKVLAAVFRAEARLVARRNLPFGVSLLALATRP
jgi:SAM-dependent methyltransferase